MHTCMFNKGFWRCVYKLAYIIHTAYIGDQLALAKETLHQRLLPKCSTGLSEVIRTLLWVCCTHLQELGVCAVQVAWVGQVQEGPAHHQVAHHCGYVCMCGGQMGTTSTLVLLMSWHECANCASVQRQASVQLFEAAVHGAVTCFHTCLQKWPVLTFSDDAVNKAHSETEEDEIVQVIDLEQRNWKYVI